MKLRLLIAPLALVGAMQGPALAIDPRIPVLDEEPAAEAKLEAFRKAHAQDAPGLKAMQGERARDQIHRALLQRKDYAQAYRGFEQSGDNAKAWRALLQRSDDLYVKAHAAYFLGRALLAQDDLEGAAQALESVRGRLQRATCWTDEATFYLAYVYARLPELREGEGHGDRERARALLSDFQGHQARYAQAPERVLEGASWLLRELRGEGMGPLLELAKRMETIERLIQRTRTGEGTQKRQKRVIKEIDRLIALMREKEKNCSGGSCKKKGKHKKGSCKKPGQAKGTPKPSSPAKKSTLPGGSSKEGQLEQPRTAKKEQWSDLRKKEREEAVQFLKKRFPSRYKALLERYYRRLSELDKRR